MRKVKFWTAFVCLIIVFSTTVYAYSTDMLKTKNKSIKTWSQKYDNIKVLTNNGTVTYDEERGIVFDCNLEVPGDYFEFTVDLVNDGLVDAEIEEIIKTGLTDNIKKFLDYNVTYLNGREIKVNDKIKAGTKETLKVNVTYKEDITAEDLPATDEEAELAFDITMVQKEDYR